MKRWVEFVLVPMLATTVGLSSCIGYLLSSPAWHELGVLSASSPLPIPFTDKEGFEHNFAYRYSMTVETDEGLTITVPVKLETMIGPHRRIVMYEIASILWPKSSFLMTNFLSYICQAAPLHRDLADVSFNSVKLNMYAPDDYEKSVQEIYIVCGQ